MAPRLYRYITAAGWVALAAAVLAPLAGLPALPDQVVTVTTGGLLAASATLALDHYRRTAIVPVKAAFLEGAAYSRATDETVTQPLPLVVGGPVIGRARPPSQAQVFHVPVEAWTAGAPLVDGETQPRVPRHRRPAPRAGRN